jgi:hypothetical protein
MAYLRVILGSQNSKTEITKGVTADTVAHVLERRGGSDSEVFCCFTDVKEFDSWEECENCHQYCVEICSGVRLPKML